MELKSARLTYLKKGRMEQSGIDGVQHTKTLPWLSIVQAVTGSYSIALGNGAEESTQDRGFFIAPAHVTQRITHNTDRESNRFFARWIFVDLRLNGPYTPEELYDLPTVLTGNCARRMSELFDALFASPSLLAEKSLVYAILDELLTHAHIKELPSARRFAKSLAFIQKHYAEPISVRTLADLECMSESNYYALFRRSLGTSPISYINHYRLSLAAEALVGNTETVSAIAASVGIPDPLYFSKLFYRAYRTSPTEYRKKRK